MAVPRACFIDSDEVGPSALKSAKCKYSYKKNEGKYKITFCHNGYKYEYELLAPTGKVVEWEMELIGK